MSRRTMRLLPRETRASKVDSPPFNIIHSPASRLAAANISTLARLESTGKTELS